MEAPQGHLEHKPEFLVVKISNNVISRSIGAAFLLYN